MMSGTSEAEATSGKQNGETFNEEMKDYAKSTMNELLGMFGYEEEITREAVEELQIKLLPEADEQPRTNVFNNTAELEKNHSEVPSAEETPYVVQIPGTENDNVARVLPSSAVNNAANPVQPLPKTAVNPSVPSDTNKPGTALAETANEVHSSSSRKDVEESSGVSTSDVFVTYTSSPPKNSWQKMRLCSWCKKSTLLKDFTSSDGEKVVFCKGLCSATCFEQAMKNIKENDVHITNTQENLRSQGLPGTNKTVPETSLPTAPITRSASRGSANKPKDESPIPPKMPPAQAGPRGVFSWNEYLAETGSIAARWHFFKQSSTPPYNGFECNMKLEVADPRIVDTMCVATVVGLLGPRIRCRFDGTDSANDVWHLVDSKEIHPVGWCEGNGGRLQPPVGFKLDPGKYSTFLAKTLTTAKLAPVRLFKREPTSPKENFFEVGMKLEALDPKNPLLICVATVAGVDGDRIRVDFDGYLGSDYWCRYDSRDIFPVGWCYYSGHPLQPPGKTKKALKHLSAKTKEKLPEKPTKPEKPEKPDKQEKKKSQTTSPVQPVPPTTKPTPTPTVSTPSTTRRESPSSYLSSACDGDELILSYTVQVFINHGCYPGPHLSRAKVLGLPSCFRGTVLNVARDCFQSIVNAGIEPVTVFGILKPGAGKTKITVNNGKRTLSCFLQSMDRVSRFWCVLDKLAENLKCCENMFSGDRISGKCPKCGGSAPRRNTVLPDSPPATSQVNAASTFKRSANKDRDLEEVKRTRITIDDDDRDNDDDDVSSAKVGSTSPPTTWSVDEVVKFIEKSELAEHADMFKKHEIDGKALLLLTREMIMSYMGLKLGPAIKLLGCIEDLKPKKSR